MMFSVCLAVCKAANMHVSLQEAIEAFNKEINREIFAEDEHWEVLRKTYFEAERMRKVFQSDYRAKSDTERVVTMQHPNNSVVQHTFNPQIKLSQVTVGKDAEVLLKVHLMGVLSRLGSRENAEFKREMVALLAIALSLYEKHPEIVSHLVQYAIVELTKDILYLADPVLYYKVQGLMSMLFATHLSLFHSINRIQAEISPHSYWLMPRNC